MFSYLSLGYLPPNRKGPIQLSVPKAAECGDFVAAWLRSLLKVQDVDIWLQLL